MPCMVSEHPLDSLITFRSGISKGISIKLMKIETLLLIM